MTFHTRPETVIFYEKPGCKGNARQKKLLQSRGVTLEVRSILHTPWSEETLLPFFEGLRPKEMINPFAPQIKNKEIDPEKLSKKQLVAMMIQTPLLIKRPLMRAKETFICGFDLPRLSEALQRPLDGDMRIGTCRSDEECS